MPKLTSAGKVSSTMRVVLVTMDNHLSTAAQRAALRLSKQSPGLSLTIHCAALWRDNDQVLARCVADIETADLVIVTMLFMEDHFLPILPALKSRREACAVSYTHLTLPTILLV